MRSRSIAALFFVALCLVLCGLILRRQIAAHPLPPQDAQATPENPAGIQGGPVGFQGNPYLLRWRTADPAVSRAARLAVQGQLDAFRAGDAAKALSYGSRQVRREFPNPNQFLQMIETGYPDFGRCRHADYGQVLTDPTKVFVRMVVQVEGDSGHRVNGEYLMVREDGRYRIVGVGPIRRETPGQAEAMP